MHYKSTNLDPIRSIGHRFDGSRRDSRPARGFGYAWQQLRRWMAENEAIRHLESLDDSRLEDLGIERAEIVPAVRGLFAPRAQLQSPGEASREAPASHRLAA